MRRCAAAGLALPLGCGAPGSPRAGLSGGIESLESAGPEAVYPYRWAPQRVSRTPEEEAEARLAAFAEAVERRRLVAPGTAAPVVLDGEGLSAAITAEIERLRDQAEVSVHIRDIPSGEVLFDYFGDRQLIPASNNKVVTAAAALALLGPDRSFETTVFRRGSTLYLRGTGDPLLHEEDLDALAADTHAVIGEQPLERLVVDDTLFSGQRFGPGYSDTGLGHAYTAPSGALSLEYNTVQVTVYAAGSARRPVVRVAPDSTHIEVDNRATVGNRDTLRVASREHEGRTRIEVSGTFDRRRGAVRLRRRIYDPARFTAETFLRMLADRGVSPPGELVFEAVHPEAVPLARHISPPLYEIVAEGMAYSNNFISEQLLRALGGDMTGRPGAWDNGQEVVAGFWAALGRDPGELVFENGSGFSRNGRVSSSALVDLIDVAYRIAPSHGLVDALPVAGQEGTLKARLRSSGRRVRAKTGTLAGVSGLTGVILAENGDDAQIAFSILVNAVEGDTWLYAARRRELEDAIVMWVLYYLDDFEARRGFLSFPPLWVYGENNAPPPGAAAAPSL